MLEQNRRRASYVLQQLSTGAPQDERSARMFPYDFGKVKRALDRESAEVKQIAYTAVVTELTEALRKKRTKVDLPDLTVRIKKVPLEALRL